MKIYHANQLCDIWEPLDNGDHIVTDSITFEIGGYVYQVGQSSDDDGTNDNIWFSRRKIEDYIEQNDTHEEVSEWVPEVGSCGFDDYNKKQKLKEFKFT
jgi:hypothetical protein